MSDLSADRVEVVCYFERKAPGNPFGHPKGAHSVLTEHLIDQPGTPTREALDRVLDFFTDRLLGSK